MSEKWAKMPQALVLDRRVSDGAKVLWSRLYHHEYRRTRWGKALPTRKALAAELGRGGSTVGNQLGELELYGWITVHRQGNGQRWDRIETHMVSQNPGAPVISDPGAPNPEDEPESWRIPEDQLQVPRAETPRSSRIYSGPGPKNEGQGLIPRASTSGHRASTCRPDADAGSDSGGPHQWTMLLCGSPAACPCGGDPVKLGYCLHPTEVPAEVDDACGLRPIKAVDNVVPIRRHA